MRAAVGSAVALAALVAAGAPAVEERTVERRLAMMGTELTVVVEATGPGGRAAALAASERAVRALEATEARLSTWRSDSELARVNAAPPGEAVAVSAATASELAAARGCWRETGGAFDPTLGALVSAWGLRTAGRRPSAGELASARVATGMGQLALGATSVTRRAAGLTIEEGGFGKGAGLDRALAALAADPAVASAQLDLGGQVAVAGRRTVLLTVADPAERLRPAVALAIDRGSVATSGTAVRGRHLLDPRSGEPAADFAGSVTVWAATALAADCLSTGLYVLGPERAPAWALGRPGVDVLVLRRRGDRLVARATPRLAARLTPVAPEVVVEVVSEGSPERPVADPLHTDEGGGRQGAS